MAKRKVASVTIRVYPGTHVLLKKLTDKYRMTIGEVVEKLVRFEA